MPVYLEYAPMIIAKETKTGHSDKDADKAMKDK
jgi:hypothetical protein